MNRRLYISILILGMSLIAHAQDTLSLHQDSLLRQLQLDEVQVVARQRKEVVPPQTLSGGKLEALSVNSVADAVRYFSGVQIKDYGGVGGMKTVDVRSMGSHHLGVFYDGIEIGNAQNGTVDLGKFSMDNLDEIQLYNGQKSDIFQPAKDFGSAGTLYLKTRHPRFRSGKNYNVEIRMKAGSFGHANPSVLYEQKLTDNLHLSANAEYTYANGHYHFRYRKVLPNGQTAWDTTAVRQNGDVMAGRAEVGFFGYLPDGKWHVKGYHYQSKRGIPGAIVNNVWKNSQRQWDRNSFVQGHLSNKWTLGRSRHHDLDVQFNAKYSNDWMRYQNPDTTLMYLDNQFLQQEIYASAAARYAIFPFWDVAVATDYQLNWLESNMSVFARPLRHTLLVSAATAVSYKWLKAQASVLDTYIHDVTRGVGQAAKARNAVTPAVFVNIKPYLPEEFYLRAFYKMVFRMPTFNDLYYTDVGNISLEPEKTRQYDLGAEYTRHIAGSDMAGGSRLSGIHIGLKADAYFNQVENKIVAIPKGNSQYRWMMMNLGYVEIWGAETAADLGLYFSEFHHLDFHGGYTWQQALDKTDPTDNDPYGGTYGGQIAYIPRHSFSGTVTYRWNDRLTASYAFVYVGSRYTSSANIPANYVQPWYTHDLTLSYKWHLSNGMGLQAGIEVNNLLNQQYEVIPNYPMPGLNGKGIIKISL